MNSKSIKINNSPDVIRDIISHEKLMSIYVSISNIVLGSDIYNFDDLAAELEKKALTERNDFLVKMRAASRSIDIKNILEPDRLKEIAKFYGIKEPVQFSNSVLHASGTKITFGSKGVDAHQDWPSTLGSYNSIIIWISLGGANKDSGGLFFYESDEQVKLLPGSIDTHVVSVDECFLQAYTKKYYAVEAGSALIFGHFIPHASECKETRLSVSVRIEDASDLDWFNRGYEFSQTTKILRKTFSDTDIEEINDRIGKS